jgi:hypothetical protein
VNTSQPLTSAAQVLRPVSLSGFFFYSPSEIYFKGFQRLLQTSSLSRHVKILTRAGKNPLTGDRSAIYSVRKEKLRRHGLQTVHLTRQAMYCTYNVTVRRVRVTIVAVEKQYYIF